MFTCDESECNSLAIQEEYCYSLNYDLDDISALGQLSDGNSKKCSFDIEPAGCYHAENKATHRMAKSCTSELTSMKLEELNKSYKVLYCKGNNCNFRLRPISCLTCKSSIGSSDCTLNLENVKREECANDFDQCFTHSEDGISFERGCLGSVQSEDIKNKCSSNDRFCAACDNDYNCNDLIKSSEFCYSQENKVKECSFSLNPLGCYLYRNPKTRVVDKGCISDLSDEVFSTYSQQKLHFETCFGENCNSDNIETGEESGSMVSDNDGSDDSDNKQQTGSEEKQTGDSSNEKPTGDSSNEKPNDEETTTDNEDQSSETIDPDDTSQDQPEGDVPQTPAGSEEGTIFTPAIISVISIGGIILLAFITFIVYKKVKSKN